MDKILQCARCMARNEAPHAAGCRGRKVRITRYLHADYIEALDAGFPTRPVNIHCFDNGGRSADRYTLVRTTPTGVYQGQPIYFYAAANSHPYHPQGIGMFTETQSRPLWGAGQWGSSGREAREHGNVPVRWADLPMQVRELAWDLATDDVV